MGGEAIPLEQYKPLIRNDEKIKEDLGSISTARRFSIEAERAKDKESAYIKKAEDATQVKDVFKFLVLMDTASIEKFVLQTRVQAEKSFQAARYAAIGGFILILVGLGIGIVSNFVGDVVLDTAYISAVAGIITEFISGVFFVLYNRTLEQLNLVHDKMVKSKQAVMSFFASSSITTQDIQEKSQVELAKTLMKASAES